MIQCKNCPTKRAKYTTKQLCSNCYKKEYRKNNNSLILAYTRKNKKTIDRQKKEWVEKNKEHCLKLHRINRNRDYKKNRNRNLVRSATWRKYGKATKCISCESTTKINHHHYTLPYHIDKFIDLCTKCHVKTHSGASI